MDLYLAFPPPFAASRRPLPTFGGEGFCAAAPSVILDRMEEPRPYRQSTQKFARGQRRTMTRAETMLWWAVRNHQIDGHAFRRQMPIGPSTVDFACPSHRLVVEVDGRTHEDRRRQDADRDTWFHRAGWRVLRFSDDLVIGGVQLVADEIRRVLAEGAC